MISAATALLATPAFAQTEPAAEPAPDDNVVVVTATRTARPLTEVPASISVQQTDQLQRDGFTYGTDEFRGVTGISFRRGEGDGDAFPFVSVRGSTGTDGFLALIDGVPFVGALEEPLLSDVPYDAIERVEIVKGPVSALYGRGAIYGAVNYITRSPRQDRIGLSLSAGSDGYFRGSASISRRLGDAGGALLSVSYENNEGWREQSRREVLSIFGKVELDLGPRTRLTLTGNYLDRDYELPNGIPLTADGRVIDVVGGRENFLGFGDTRDHSRGFIGSARIEHAFSDAFSITVTGQHRDYDRPEVFLNFYDAFGFDPSRNVFAVNGFRNETGQSVWFGEATARYESGAHTILAGASYEESRTRTFSSWSGQYGFTPDCGFAFYLVEIDYRTGAIVNRNHPCFVIDQPQSDQREAQRFFGGFIQWEWRITDRLTATIGGRYDNFRRLTTTNPITGLTDGGTLEIESDAFSPKAALTYRTGFGNIYAAYGRGFGSNFGAGFENDPVQYFRPELKPTTIDSYEIGARGELLNGLVRFDAALFYTRQRDRRQIIPNPAAENDFSVPPNLITFGSLYDVRGVELALTIRPSRDTILQAQYSHLDPVWEEFVLDGFSGPQDFSGTTPRGVARNIVYLSAQHQFTPWLNGRAVFEWYDDYAVTLDNALETGGYHLLTLGARIRPPSWRGLSLDLVVTNALDEDYYFYFGGTGSNTYATPGPPRQFRATLRADF
ncbi:MAG TPA: TonB-dependent receptor [Allosphingosinicella sp.]|nr:TonB-dependent receptor [Allosphingosinicella sp.]